MQTILIGLDTRINNYASVDLMQGYNYTLEAHITDNYKDVDLTGVTVQLQMQKSDKKFIIQTENIIIEGNKIKATLDKDFTREDGQAKLQVVLFKDNFTFGSWVVKAKIKPSAINDNDGQSENKVTITEALVNKISEAENTKIELDKSIANGDVATIKGNVDKIKDVEIPKINEQLEHIETRIIPTLSLIFDDGLIDNTRVVTLLKERGLICDFALQGYWQSALDNRYFNNGDLKKWTKQGFGILSHTMYHYDLRPSDTSLSKAEYDISTSKKVLKDLGFNINGFVPANSTINSKFDYLLENYTYSFCGYYAPQSKFPIMNSKTDRKKLWRLGIDNTDISIIKETIDNTIIQNGYTCLYGHTIGVNFSEEKLIEILDYIKLKVNSNEIELLKADDAVTKTFGVSMDYSITNKVVENLATNVVNNHNTAYRYYNQYKLETLKGNAPTITTDELKNEMSVTFNNNAIDDVFTIQYYFENTKDLSKHINHPISVKFNIEGNNIDFANISCEGRFFKSDGSSITTTNVNYTYMNKENVNEFIFYPTDSSYNSFVGVIFRITLTQATSNLVIKFNNFKIGYGTKLENNLKQLKYGNELKQDKFVTVINPDSIAGDSAFHNLAFKNNVIGYENSMIDIANGRILAIKDGYININTSLSFSNSVIGKRVIIRCFINGKQHTQKSMGTVSTGHNGFEFSTLCKVSKGDYITIGVFQDTGSNMQLADGYSFISGYYI